MPDFTAFPLAHKLRKVLRYARLYGPARTLTKVRAQYFMRGESEALSATWRNPKRSSGAAKDVAIIGCGNFAYSTIAFYCNKARPGCIRSTFDVAGRRSIGLCRAYGGSYAASDPAEIFDDPEVATVFIASNHASHAEFAISALNAGKRVHIEKPHVVSEDQLERLIAAVSRSGHDKLFLGFNRPRSKHFRLIRDAAARESGPFMINWFVAGHEIEDTHWYFSAGEGGRILGNLCHWTDLTMRIVGTAHSLPAIVIPGSLGENKSDFALSFNFADGSVASITFSAKGHTFEGVREYLNLHRGDTLVSMRDFHTTVIDRGPARQVYRSLFRDHGHGANIINSLRGTEPEPLESAILSARLFLAAKQAIDERRTVAVEEGGSD